MCRSGSRNAAGERGIRLMEVLTYLGTNIFKQPPFFMGIIVSALMGIFLTLPISSAAIGIMLNLSGIAAGAACAGCSAHMIGFAVMSFKENGVQGLIAQGIGTSMHQIKNLMKTYLFHIKFHF